MQAAERSDFSAVAEWESGSAEATGAIVQSKVCVRSVMLAAQKEYSAIRTERDSFSRRVSPLLLSERGLLSSIAMSMYVSVAC
jgi:hypothetical protein